VCLGQGLRVATHAPGRQWLPELSRRGVSASIDSKVIDERGDAHCARARRIFAENESRLLWRVSALGGTRGGGLLRAGVLVRRLGCFVRRLRAAQPSAAKHAVGLSKEAERNITM
jgi:hypothetical protein